MKAFIVLSVSALMAVNIFFCPMAVALPPSMPDDVQMVQPDPSLPRELAAYWGQWEGTEYDKIKQMEIQMFLVIDKITAEKASIYYWRSDMGWSPRREVEVTKENILWFIDRGYRIEIVLQGELLLWNIPDRYFSFKLKRATKQ